MHSPIIAPAILLVAWTLVMLVWTMVVRIPALKKAGIDMSKVSGGRPGILDTMLPEKAQWPAHNYIHLAEQPTIFYAIIFSLALLGADGSFSVALAWAYVGLRVVHSIVQATVNRIALRFLLFVASSLVLIALTIQALLALCNGTAAV